MNIKKNISVEKVRSDAEELFKGGFLCSEAVVSAIRSNFELDIPEEVIAIASGFPVGVGGAKCLCGAVSGGVISLGLFFGRTKQNDPKIGKSLELAKELHDYFKANNGKNAICCRVLTKEFEKNPNGQAEQCIRFTGMAAAKVAEIIIRELNLTNTDCSLNKVTTN